ncbi:hypothetical protein [Streptomyces fragilis]|uniref:Integral membrane protein n=1 Tax=Streptomyces fragilis TaxID=67301 RepID=A0ABV2YJE4_9ACTN|nr:hypothetical protein [Streptomyces fragilis]
MGTAFGHIVLFLYVVYALPVALLCFLIARRTTARAGWLYAALLLGLPFCLVVMIFAS